MTVAAEASTRVRRLIDFLAAYDAMKHPPVHDLALYGLYALRDSDLPEAPGVRLHPAVGPWLTVDFVDLPTRPAVPAHLEPCLGPTEAISPTRQPVISLPDPPTAGDIALAEKANAWVADTWEPWSIQHEQAEVTKRLYRDLFEQRERLNAEREAVELAWGFGRLRWRPSTSSPVDHPLLTIPVEIDIDPASNQLSVRPSGAVAVESLFLADIPLDDRASFTAICHSLAEADSPLDPWDPTATTDLLRRLIRTVDQDGVIAGEGAADENAATVEPGWTLFLRRRRPDYQGFLDTMRSRYQEGAIPPDPLQALVVDAPSTLIKGDGSDEHAQAPADPLLLPLEVNEEQQRILTLAQRRAGVTVQGPPGTGKSHTIANIISHSVAYGQRVLIVAEKEQALRVLADKIPDGIRDLTVSVLGSDAEGRRRLESSISRIQSRVTAIDRSAADEQIERLTRELDRLDRQTAETTGRLLATRKNEARRLSGRWAAGKAPTPAEAARWIADHQAELGYVDDPIDLDTPPPLSVAEFSELLRLLDDLGTARVEAYELTLPPTSSLPAGVELAAKFGQLDAARLELDEAAPELRSWTQVDAADTGFVEDLAQQLGDAHRWAVKTAGTWVSRLRDQLADPPLAEAWHDFATTIRAEREQILTVGRALAAHSVTVPDNPPPTLVTHLQVAKDRLHAKGKLGLFAREARRALETCLVDGRQPVTENEVQLCLHALRQQELRRRLATRWANRSSHVDGPALGPQPPEDAVGPLIEEVVPALSWHADWERLASALRALGIGAPPDPTPEELARLAAVTRLACRRPVERALASEVDTLAALLAEGAATLGASPYWQLLADALAARQTETWDQHRKAVAALEATVPQAQRLMKLHRRLSAATPAWARRIIGDPAAAGNPATLPEAWQWRQLDTWLDTVRGGADPATLQRELEDLSLRRRRAVTEVVTERAWRRLADNLGDRERQALNGYLQAVKRFGRTGGKYAARWLQQIRQALNESKDAVPVWIMPTSRALTSFRPDHTPPFDLLIIDEASQLGLEALPLLSLARTAIVVGDDKQTSPDNVGVDRQATFNLLDEHLASVPKYRTLFDADNSLYDVAFQKFPDVVMLTEHFRCLPQIIQFSNVNAYDGRIVPLRDRAPTPDWKPLGAIRVADGYRTGFVNKPEADAVVDLVACLCADPDYDGMDLGVVSLLGSSQSKHIWEKLWERLGKDVLTERRLRVGEPANFQGDERDVIVLSTVVAVDPDRPTARIAAMTGRSAERRINVAASRARNQVWVVHSVDPELFPAGDLRGALIRHCQNPGTLETELQDLESACDSDFERRVLRRILARGYRRVSVQHQVGRFRIDIVIEGPSARLAVECDGDRWHDDTVWHRDLARQQILERAGWTFERIRGSDFYRDPDRALDPLWSRLAELGIPVGDEWVSQSPRTTARTVTGRHELAPPSSLPHPASADADIGSAQAAGWSPPARETPPQRRPAPSGQSAETRPAPQAPGSQPSAEPPAKPVRTVANDAPHRPRGNVNLAPYRRWNLRQLPAVHSSNTEQITEGLVEIIAAEGPMHALDAYQLYVKAAGAQRVGGEVQRTLNDAVTRALRRRELEQINDRVPGRIRKTLYLPGTAPVVVRELGSRQIVDIPRSEIKALVELLGMTGRSSHRIKRAVLDALGLTRLTKRASVYLDECFTYDWSL